MKNKILLLSSLVATTYSADSGHSVSPFSYNLVDTSYFVINVGLSHNSNFLSLINKDKLAKNKKFVERNLTNDQKGEIKGQLSYAFNTDTVQSLNFLSVVQAIVDINFIAHPLKSIYVSWHAMTIVRHALYHNSLSAEVKDTDGAEPKTDSKKTLFWLSYAFPTLTFDMPYIAFRIDTAQLLLYFTQLKYFPAVDTAVDATKNEKNMYLISGVLLSSVRLCPKFFNNHYGHVITSKVLDIAFAATAAFLLKDFSFQVWKKKAEAAPVENNPVVQ